MLHHLLLTCPCQINSTRSTGKSSLYTKGFNAPVFDILLVGFQPGLRNGSFIDKVITGISFFKQGLFGKIIP